MEITGQKCQIGSNNMGLFNNKEEKVEELELKVGCLLAYRGHYMGEWGDSSYAYKTSTVINIREDGDFRFVFLENGEIYDLHDIHWCVIG